MLFPALTFKHFTRISKRQSLCIVSSKLCRAWLWVWRLNSYYWSYLQHGRSYSWNTLVLGSFAVDVGSRPFVWSYVGPVLLCVRQRFLCMLDHARQLYLAEGMMLLGDAMLKSPVGRTSQIVLAIVSSRLGLLRISAAASARLFETLKARIPST